MIGRQISVQGKRRLFYFRQLSKDEEESFAENMNRENPPINLPLFSVSLSFELNVAVGDPTLGGGLSV